MTMGSTFTGEGVLVGPKEYGVYSAIARLIIVAFISDIAFRLVFAQRIGIFLISELSIGAGARATIRSLYRPPYPAYPRLWACSLFALAFLVTRGLDVLVSTYFSARKEHSVKRYSHVSAADLSKRNLIAGTFVGALMNRSDVHSVLLDITKDVSGLRQGQWWPEAVGMLTDAEIAAVTLARSPCVDVQDPTPPAANFDWMPTKFSPELMDNDMGQTFPFFGQEILFLDMSLDSACIPGSVATVPMPIGYLAAQPGRGPVSQISSRQIGLLVSASGDIDAYDMECGLSPDDVSRWITQYQPRPRVAGEANSAGLWYNDYHMHPRDKMGFPQGKSTFFLFNATSDRQGDMLSFGGRIPRDPYGVRARIVTRSITAPAILHDDEIPPTSVPLDHAPSLACQDTQVPYFGCRVDGVGTETVVVTRKVFGSLMRQVRQRRGQPVELSESREHSTA
ncbi:hypothetical protein BCR44DRAFT_1173220 [Catenaria anguillulae PL171]|uniref:Uncharacterized protein n=1 Tax=Catenaria anguillulae PL171 TaxID=765915 RepID=A0A1Y2I4K9_9FUNG|nr:hypothetical protein BCR44DRAFT_1173220 [Catenaria anguillulae PL171]